MLHLPISRTQLIGISRPHSRSALPTSAVTGTVRRKHWTAGVTCRVIIHDTAINRDHCPRKTGKASLRSVADFTDRIMGRGCGSVIGSSESSWEVLMRNENG